MKGALCFVRDGDGTFCMGDRSHGLDGSGRTAAELPQEVVRGDFVAVTLGHDHVCALARDGRVSCWGDNYYGQLGRAPRWRGGEIDTIPGLRAKKIVSGYSHTCALDQEDRVVCWGRFDETKYNQFGPIFTEPTLIEGLRPPIVDLISGWAHVCAQNADGVIACFGNNVAGQIPN